MESPVEFAALELQKENILPLTGGRSAAQLVSLSSQTRSGLGDKLAAEHARYQAALAALEAYDGGATETTGYTAEELSALAEDPLDLHHQYARFVLNSYPAGPSSASRLLPLLESSTRRFLDDERYTNDPRYLRLWNLYARNIERPEECYRFLFAKRIGERLAVLYEEYALVLEAAGKRHQADQIYLLGIARLAVPLDRLRKRHQAFQARMLVAPPLPSTPPPSSPSPTPAHLARPILAGQALVPTVPTSNSGPTISNAGGRENGSRGFNVFQDTAGSSGGVGEDGKGGWDDFGTVKSRNRENEVEAKEWKGETLPMGNKAVGGGFKLDVFRDNDAPITPAKSLVDQQDAVLLRSIRGPSEGELLRLNPFKNYSEVDLGLSAIDPLLNLPLPPIASTSTSASTATAGATTATAKPRLKSTSSSTSIKKSSSGSKAASTSKVSSTGTEKVACDLKAIYPAPGIEISFEELKLRSNASYSIDGMNGWEYAYIWREEVARKGLRSWLCDPLTGWPALYSPKTGLPLYDFLAPPSPPTPPRLSPELQNIPLPQPESPPYHQTAENAFDSPPGSPGEMTRKFRVPSPTMNTREAQAMIDGLFSKTLNFDAGGAVLEEEEESGSGSGSEESESGSGSGSEEEGEGRSFVFDSQPVVAAAAVAPPFVLHSDSNLSQQPSSNDITPESPLRPFAPSDENRPQELTSTRSQGGFRPVARTPLGAKSIGLGGAGAGGRAFEVAADPILPTSSTASTSSEQEREYDDEEEGEEYGNSTAPLRSAQFSIPHQQQTRQPSERHFSPNGFSMGRRAVGTNRYAPLIDNMTPITERTAEYNNYSISKSGFKGFGAGVGPRVSVAPDVRGVVEEDEEEEEESRRIEESSTEDEDEEEGEGEEGGDRAFVGGGEMQSTDEGDSSQTEDDEYESQESQSQRPVPILLPSLQSPLRRFIDPIIPSANRQPTRTNEIDNSADGTLFSNLENTAGDVVVPIADLSEGYTISGNQSGMNTGTVAETTIIKTLDSELLSMDSLSIDGGRNETVDGDEEEEVEEEEVEGPGFANPCNPFDSDIIESVLSRCSPSLVSLPNVHNLAHIRANKLDDLQKMAKRRIDKGPSSRSSGGGKDRTGLIEDIWSLELDGQVFSVREKLGEGSFGAVFRIAVDSPGAANTSDDRSFDEDQEDEEAEGSVAVKVERPTNRWEFYVLSQLASRLPPSLLPSVVSAKSLYLYKDESYLFLDFSDQGTLLDAVNSANDSGTAPPTSSASSGLEEILAIFFTVELLRVVEGFHRAGIVHGDLKIDNCLVRLGEVSGRDWKATYEETGAGGWAKKGVRVIDFGRSVDVASFGSTKQGRPEQRFKTNFVTSSFDCPEMQEKRSWTYEPDYFGIASIAFTLLFGRFIETTTSTDSLFNPSSSTTPRERYIISQNFKRYQQAELWGKLFHALLNPALVRREAGGEGSEIREELAVVRGEMEEWLRRNSDKGGKSLKGLLKKMEMFSLTRFGR